MEVFIEVCCMKVFQEKNANGRNIKYSYNQMWRFNSFILIGLEMQILIVRS
jgi:hypothetical protein